MKNKTQAKNTHFINKILLIAYGSVTFLIPNFKTLDSNGPKFLGFAILNIIVFFILLNTKSIKNNKPLFFDFFTNKIGIAYSLLMFFSLLSFVKAINISESILHFSKIFTTFSAAWLISIIIKNDKSAIKPLAIVMSGLLLIDNYQTFKGIFLYSKGKLPYIESIIASYSNKNILSSAIFVKMPFALWLFFFHTKWKKYLGGLALFTSILAILFLSSRAFYLAIFLSSIILTAYFFLMFKRKKEKKHLYNIGIYFSFLIVAFTLFYFIRSNFYPKNVTFYNKSITNRVKSISNFDARSTNFRLSAWKRSFKLIEKNPLLGVGLGNWKINVLKDENKTSFSYTYMYKNHNDFIEITAESGIFAGIAFISIFLFILWYFAVVLLKKPNEAVQKILFLPTLGIIIYSFDAFFNFPQNRAEIQPFFSLYVGMTIGIVLLFKEDVNLKKDIIKKTYQTTLTIITGILLIGISYILYMNVISLQLQRIIKDEITSGTLKSSSSLFNNFPPIPNITILSEPIAVQKARYLLKEGKHKKARALLKGDNSNPYDARKEYFLAASYFNKGKYDSALYYAKISHKLKPLYYEHNMLLELIYTQKGEPEKATGVWKEYLQKTKKKVKPWIALTTLLEKQGKYNDAMAIIDSAYLYRPNNKKIKHKKRVLELKVKAGKHLPVYNKAVNLYSQKKYLEAIPYFNNFINNVPKYSKAYELRAICYFRTKKYNKALDDIATLKNKNGKLNANILNIKGSCYLILGHKKKALECFKKSMDLGSKNGKINYLKFSK